jgi:hypothetical protein
MSADPLQPPGALARWRAEMRAGKRGDPARPSTWLLDATWLAAAWEKSGLQALAEGFTKAAAADFAAAREILATTNTELPPADDVLVLPAKAATPASFAKRATRAKPLTHRGAA